MTFAVMGVPSAGGNAVALRRGFATSDAAEAHPVRMKHWLRVWIEEEPPKATPSDDAPLPWSIEHDGRWDYIVDATGKRLGSIYGSAKRRIKIAELISARMGAIQP